MRVPLLSAAAMLLAAGPALAAEMSLSSPEISSGGTFQTAQVANVMGCRGKNHSPALSWSGEPAGTQSFAITMYDPDAPTGHGWWHWTVFNIPANVHQLGAGAGDAVSTGLPPGAIEGRVDFGFTHYGGPCPPPGPAHHYEITVYALRVAKLPLDKNATAPVVSEQLRANALASGQIVGLYSSKPKKAPVN
jgi:Raf kinase inhibitor-like YbhB/YbcL family protein